MIRRGRNTCGSWMRQGELGNPKRERLSVMTFIFQCLFKYHTEK